MLITFKTITQQMFKLELGEDATIADVKAKIAAEHGEKFEVSLQKLIYNGKILEDQQTIGELKITGSEKQFIVVMVSRKKPEETSQTASSSSASTLSGDTKMATEKEKKSEVPMPSAATTGAAGEPLSMEVSPEHAQMIEMIQGMGYPKEEVIRALKAAFFNADRAVEYLCNGIPESLNLQNAPLVAPAAGEEQGEGEEGVGELDPNSLEFLANSPQFQQLRDLVRANPALLPQILQAMDASNPQLMNAIRANQQEFLQLLNAPAGEDEEVGAGNVAEQAAAGVMTVTVTAEERAAINRIAALGVPEQLALEAYLACDKNEELAANYCLERMDEWNQEGAGGGV